MRRRGYRRTTILLSLALFASPAVLRAQTTTPIQDVAQIVARLNDDSLRQEDRDEAARRLLTRNRSELRKVLESGNRNAQLAVARALAVDGKPADPALAPFLFRLMGPDRVLTDAAGEALARYRDNPDVLVHLINLARATAEREGTRVTAIRALGSTADKNVADTLIGLLSDQSPAITTAAATSLVDMTGLRENGSDAPRWQKWWAENVNRSEEEFHLEMLKEQAGRFDRLRIRERGLEEELGSVLSDQYQLTPDAQKPDVLLRFLRSDEPAIRQTGARLVFEDAVNNQTIPPATLDQLRSMIADSSAKVRVATADALRAVNDPQAITPLLSQLTRETDDSVRSAIARALATSGDLRAVEPLKTLLHDPSLTVAQSAADAIREIAGKLDAGAAQQMAAELRSALDQHDMEPAARGLKESIVLAMGPLREISLLPVYYRLLRSHDEPSAVRRAAVKGVGQLGQPQAADALVNLLEDPDATVRLEAVDALGKIGTYQQIGPLYDRLEANHEPDSSVRDHAWQVMSKLFTTAPADQLGQWAERFANEPQRKLVVLMALASREGHDNPQTAEPLAYTSKAIGETLLSLNRPADAVDYLKQSLAYWNVKDPKGMSAVSVTQELLTALLRAKQYPAAVAFGGQLLAADVSNQQTVGPAVRAEVQRLVDTNDLAGAQALIAEARKMSPALDSRYVQSLDDLEKEIQQRQSGPKSAGARWNDAGLAGWA
ncbi:MAG TPA: HEAT repeat domain-containing protein [Tepidisphaeraceae bacterium]|jgi:HEAT repeat protein|nr:HEAT repeat domain-containing protein [Tepidisphaeraceae bacterium]